MENNIIASILEIEQNAQKRLEEAEKKKNQLIADAKAEEEKLINEKISKVENDLKKIELEEQKKTDEKLAEIEKRKKEEIRRLDEVFENNHAEWENSIFGSIIGG
ncbi:MAG: hypothetical protein J6C96_10340 [Oscillospiraceae bacterium]|nr:hypothetical protein [Oscillospiraceae bacterium]